MNSQNESQVESIHSSPMNTLSPNLQTMPEESQYNEEQTDTFEHVLENSYKTVLETTHNHLLKKQEKLDLIHNKIHVS